MLLCPFKRKLDRADRSREAFRVFDKNTRGVIEAGDLKLIFQTLDPDMTDEEVEQLDVGIVKNDMLCKYCKKINGTHKTKYLNKKKKVWETIYFCCMKCFEEFNF